MESILTSIKKQLGIAEDYEHFDPDIIMNINSVFMTLTQLGVGPSEGFYIEDDEAIWSDFISDPRKLQAVKTYMFLKVKLVFDPSSMGSATISAYERQIQELEWRLNIASEDYQETDDDSNNSPAVPSTVQGMIVDCVKLNVRSQPSTASDVVAVLDVNTKVMVDTSMVEGEWYRIYTDTGIKGYCLKTNVRIYL